MRRALPNRFEQRYTNKTRFQDSNPDTGNTLSCDSALLRLFNRRGGGFFSQPRSFCEFELILSSAAYFQFYNLKVMAKIIEYETRTAPGETILGGLFLFCGALLIATPFLALLGTLFGQVTPPKSSHEVLEIIVGLGACVVMAVGMSALGVLCLNATILPRTLHVAADALQLFWFKKKIGEIPYTNIKDANVLTRAMAGQTAQGTWAQALFRGGIIAATIAQSRFKPDEPIGFVIRVTDPDNLDMFWPKGFFKRKNPKRIEVRYYWTSPHPVVVQKIAAALSRYKCQSE